MLHPLFPLPRPPPGSLCLPIIYFSYLTPFFSFFPHCRAWSQARQRPKKVVSDSLGLVDFAIRLVNSVLNQGRVVQSWVKITQG